MDVGRWLQSMGWDPSRTTNPEGAIRYVVSRGFPEAEVRQYVYGQVAKQKPAAAQGPQMEPGRYFGPLQFGSGGALWRAYVPDAARSMSDITDRRLAMDEPGWGRDLPLHPEGNLQRYPAGSLEAMNQKAFPQGYNPTGYDYKSNLNWEGRPAGAPARGEGYGPPLMDWPGSFTAPLPHPAGVEPGQQVFLNQGTFDEREAARRYREAGSLYYETYPEPFSYEPRPYTPSPDVLSYEPSPSGPELPDFLSDYYGY